MRRFKFLGKDGSNGYKQGKSYWGYLNTKFGQKSVEFFPINPTRKPIRYTDLSVFTSNWQ